VVEFYPGPQELRLCADGVGTANADADGHTVLRDTPGAASIDADEGPR